jgi:hypothetical protein
VVSFYYDLYGWQPDSLIGRLLPDQLFERFPTKEVIDATGSLMILITGKDNSGRESLQNLILQKINAQYGERPLVTKVDLVPNLVESLKKIRTLFSFGYSEEKDKPSRQKLKAAIASAADANGELSVEAYQTLFEMWRSLISAECRRPRVLLATGADDFDLWRKVYNSVSPLFHFVVILTQYDVRAETTHVLLKRNSRNSTVIKALPLGAEAARNYLREKLANQRVTPAPPEDSLTPFADDVLATLYEPGAMARPDTIIAWDIGWLNKTLSCVLDDHVKALLARQNGGADLKALPKAELLIDGKAAGATREKMNQGI